MKKSFLLFLLLTPLIGFSQESLTNDFQVEDDFPVEVDSIVHNKNTKIKEERFFKPNLKERYNDDEFNYRDDLKDPKPKPEENKASAPPPNNGESLEPLGSILSYAFPFILAIVIVYIILKTFLGIDVGFWNFKNSTKKIADKLVHDDEDIHENDFDKLLERAINDKNYRLATRYYYLALLKKLSDMKRIKYHKDKTNTEYLFEIENKQTRKQFSEVSYIYSYVWYGEFPIDALQFKTVEKKYKSIFNSIN